MNDSLRVAGCSGGLGEPGNGSTALILNDSVALEAGSGLMNLSIERLLRINTVILSHAHFDHVCGLPFLVELRKQKVVGPLYIHGHPHTIKMLKMHFFNDQIWPDFTQIPSSSEPAIYLQSMLAGVEHWISGFNVVPIEVKHTVPTFGFLIKGTAGWLAYSGDTSLCPLFTDQLIQCPDLKHVIMECSFPTSHEVLAKITGHMHAGDLKDFRALLPREVSLWVTSIKAWHAIEIAKELAYKATQPSLKILSVGQKLSF